MSAIGGLINNTIDAATETTRGTSLADFLTKFSPAEGTFVNTIDPCHTFDVSIRFHPAASGEEDTRDTGQKVLDSLAKSGMSMLNNAANNVTGGLVGAIANGSRKPIDTQRESFGQVGKHTFLEYLTQANLMTNSDNYLGQLKNDANGQSGSSPLELNIGFYVQSMVIPQLKMEDAGQAETPFGKFPLNGRYVMPDNNQLIMSILNTRVPLLERIFYPWMREVTLPYWSYETQPYTTATITVDLTKHSDISYVFYGCRPQQFQTEQPTQEIDTTITRDITFIFDFMYVNSKLNTAESWKDKLLDTGKTLLNSATNMMNI